MERGPANTPDSSTWELRINIQLPPTITKTQLNLNERKLMPKPKSNLSQSSANANSPDMKSRIINYIRAGYPGLYLVSHEEQRVDAELKSIAQELGFELHLWSVVDGLVDAQTHKSKPANDPLEVLTSISELKEKSIILLKDFHLFLNDPNPILIRQLKDVLQRAKTQNKTLIIVGCRLCLPAELERELTVIEFTLPGKEQLGHVLNGICESAALNPIEGDERDKILAAASGMTTIEAENAFALSVAEFKAINHTIIAREKAAVVKKNGILEIIETQASLDSIGGLDVLKDWLLKRKQAFSQKAVQYGLPSPKGLMILGIAGTGKSLTAKATASVLGVPLLKLDAGRLFGGLVGQSESNLRSVLQTAEAISPCVLWIDEVEKGFAGSKSSGATDGGTSARVFGSFISWMQEKHAPVFIVATANDVSQLPPELLRKGRFDELFFVDLPNQTEREAIWNIQIKNYGRDPRDYDVMQLARASEGLTGSEIEAVFVESMFTAFYEDREPTDLTIAGALTGFVPISRLMAEQISGLRSWSKDRARAATSQPPERKIRKLAA